MLQVDGSCSRGRYHVETVLHDVAWVHAVIPLQIVLTELTLDVAFVKAEMHEISIGVKHIAAVGALKGSKCLGHIHRIDPQVRELFDCANMHFCEARWSAQKRLSITDCLD